MHIGKTRTSAVVKLITKFEIEQYNIMGKKKIRRRVHVHYHTEKAKSLTRQRNDLGL